MIQPLNAGSSKRDLLKADATPISVDRSISWDSIGGLKQHITALKEMIVLPLLYPEVFQKFHVSPPRGVLFVGPPGTGKTLVARALCNSCSIVGARSGRDAQGGKRISFFMRKGADCLSKWVGEAERQLRLLFEQARVYQPSIIFFDEIDGLTPTRSSKQDQIHSSIVSTLLALMDGLDSRGQVVVIGATNRVDTIDPALRRPGRFDREMLFDLPDLESRLEILKIHTKTWVPAPDPAVLQSLAEQTSGFAGADLKALCTEAALCALHREYPQIYASSAKLRIDSDRIRVELDDFRSALHRITPSSQRSNPHHAQPLPFYLRPLLEKPLQSLQSEANAMFPYFSSTSKQLSLVSSSPLCFAPRLLLVGESALLVDSLASAFLHSLDHCHLTQFDLLNALRDGSIQETLSHTLSEAFRNAPSVLYLPHLNDWTSLYPEAFSLLEKGLNAFLPTCPIFVLVTGVGEKEEITSLFPENTFKVFSLSESVLDRSALFSTLLPLLTRSCSAPAAAPPLPVLEVENVETQPTLTENELAVLKEREEHYLRELRIFFREVLYELRRNPRYRCFVELVKEEDVPDYYEIIKHPMCLDMMFTTVDKKEYTSLERFMKDINLIRDNAKEYNPNTSSGRKIIRAAAAMVDEVESMVHRFKKKLGYNLFQKCEEILARREQAKKMEKPKPIASPQRRRRGGKKAEEEEKKKMEEEEKKKTEEEETKKGEQEEKKDINEEEKKETEREEKKETEQEEKKKIEEEMVVEPVHASEADQKQAEDLIAKMNAKWGSLTLDECIMKYEQIVRICMEQDSLYRSAQVKMNVGTLKNVDFVGNRTNNGFIV